MPILASIGKSLLVGGQVVINAVTVTFTNYIVESTDDNEIDMEHEDIYNEDGKRVTRLIFQKDTKATLNLIAAAGATPSSDFVPKAMCTYGALTPYFVDSATVKKSKSAQRVSVSLVNLGIS